MALAAFVGKEERERMEEGEGEWDGYKYGRFSKVIDGKLLFHSFHSQTKEALRGGRTQ